MPDTVPDSENITVYKIIVSALMEVKILTEGETIKKCMCMGTRIRISDGDKIKEKIKQGRGTIMTGKQW